MLFNKETWSVGAIITGFSLLIGYPLFFSIGAGIAAAGAHVLISSIFPSANQWRINTFHNYLYTPFEVSSPLRRDKLVNSEIHLRSSNRQSDKLVNTQVQISSAGRPLVFSRPPSLSQNNQRLFNPRHHPVSSFVATNNSSVTLGDRRQETDKLVSSTFRPPSTRPQRVNVQEGDKKVSTRFRPN